VKKCRSDADDLIPTAPRNRDATFYPPRCLPNIERYCVYRRAQGDGWAKSEIRAQFDDWAQGELRVGGTNKLAFTGKSCRASFRNFTGIPATTVIDRLDAARESESQWIETHGLSIVSEGPGKDLAMIHNHNELKIVCEQLMRAELALESLRNDILPNNPRTYQVMAEPCLDMIASLRAQIGDYLGIAAMPDNGGIVISLEGARVELGRTSAASITRVVDTL
jgi:hypothetical protein